MKLDKKEILFIAIPCVFVIFLAVLFLMSLSPKLKRTTNVAFYGLSDVQVKSITTLLDESKDSKGRDIKFNYNILDTSLTLKEQITKKTDLVFTLYGVNALDAASTVKDKKASQTGFDPDLIRGCTLSVYQKSHFNPYSRLLDVIPLLLDYDIIDSRRKGLWNNMTFAGGDDKVLLDTIGCFTESLGGKKLYDSLTQYIQDNYADLSSLSSPDCPAQDAIGLIGEYIKGGIMVKDVLAMKADDVLIYMEAGLTDTVFTSLSSHRTIPYETIMKFTTEDHYPNLKDDVESKDLNSLEDRYFVAPVICAVPLSAKESMRSSLESLYTDNSQTRLSYSTGLAPIMATCDVPDIQSDDARYWIAASNTPLTPLSEYFYTDSQRKEAADALRSAINVEIGRQ